jgi:methionyl-tRNA formyltransferase
LKIGEEEKGLKYSVENLKFQIIKNCGSLEISKNEFKIFRRYIFSFRITTGRKKRMNIKDFLNGFRNFDEIKMA